MKKEKPKIVVFASGTKEGGGSGFENLVVESRKNPDFNYEVVAVVSNYQDGGVRKRADKLNVPFEYMREPTSQRYQEIVAKYNADLIALSGWLKLVKGLDSSKTINIHPGNPDKFGGERMYGDNVHRAVLEAGEKETQVAMHFVTKKYDEGPVFFRFPVKVNNRDTVQTLRDRVNKVEHKYQPFITSMVANGEISWDGIKKESLKVPEGYKWL